MKHSFIDKENAVKETRFTTHCLQGGWTKIGHGLAPGHPGVVASQMAPETTLLSADGETLCCTSDPPEKWNLWDPPMITSNTRDLRCGRQVGLHRRLLVCC